MKPIIVTVLLMLAILITSAFAYLERKRKFVRTTERETKLATLDRITRSGQYHAAKRANGQNAMASAEPGLVIPIRGR